MSLNESHCVILSPFIAPNEKVTLERLKVFSEEIKGALAFLFATAGKGQPVDADREKSVQAIAHRLLSVADKSAPEMALNKTFLSSVGTVQKNLTDLEVEILQSKKIPEETFIKATSSLTALGIFVDAVPIVYEHVL